jgi:magnesium chelatase family protein
VPAVLFQELSSQPTGENSAAIRKRVNASRTIQLERFASDKIYCNAQMNSRLIRKYCHLTDESQQIIKNAMDTMGFSARVYDRIQKVARTIADLEGSKEILPFHISEAVQYRSLDRKFWD